MAIWILDVGTSGTHGLLMNQLAEVEFSFYEEYHPNIRSQGTVEQSPLDWYQAILHACQACNSHIRKHSICLDAIALTCQRSSLLLLDENLDPIAPAMMWQDLRAMSVLKQMETTPGTAQTIFGKSGTWPNSIFTGPKILWYQKNNPDLIQKACHTTVIADYLIAKMTDHLVLDVTYAARTHLMDLITEQWDSELLNLFGASLEKLSPICKQGTIVGVLSSAFANASGFPAGVPVVSAGGDQQCAALGAAIIHPGRVLINVGTGANILAWSERPVFDETHRFLTVPAALPNGYLLETSTPTAASIYRWAHEQFYQDDPAYDQINHEVEAAEPGAHGILCLPYFQGRGTPDWNRNALGTFHGITLGSTRGDLSRAILEGIALELSECLAVMGHFDSIVLSGGLTGCPFFNQILADVTALPVSRIAQSNQTALGAWVNATKALWPERSYDEILKNVKISSTSYPSEETHALYTQIFTQKKELYAHLYHFEQKHQENYT